MIAAEQYASRLVVPSGQRSGRFCWSSHKDHAAKALAKLAGPCLPVSLKQLEQAITRAKADHDKQLKAIGTTIRTGVEEFDTTRAEPVEVTEDPDGFDAHDLEAQERDLEAQERDLSE